MGQKQLFEFCGYGKIISRPHMGYSEKRRIVILADHMQKAINNK
jgi:hypothetical protein